MTDIIRPVHNTDLPTLYRICVLIGNNGKDATHLIENPDLVGHIFVGPYVILEPKICFVAVRNGRPIGFIVAASDSQAFYERCEEEWFPPLREQFAMPEEGAWSYNNFLRFMIHNGHKPEENTAAYPAHLHINLLPEGQKMGLGRKLIETLIEKLKAEGINGLHLQVGSSNKNAIIFYERLGFHVIEKFEGSILYGMKLD